MKKSFWIVHCVCCVLVFLIVVFIFSLPHLGMNINLFNGKKPTDMGEAIWRSEDGKSWFQVEDSNICLGELYYKEKELPVYYVFGYFDRLSILLKTDDEMCVSDDDFFLDEETLILDGICKFKKKKMSVELSCEDDPEYVEKITFVKTEDDSDF